MPKEIYEIPPSSPAHNVTYVTVVEDDRRRVGHVRDGRPRYTGVMIAWGCAVWGSGWYYPPYWGLWRDVSLLLSALPDLRLRRARTTPGPARYRPQAPSRTGRTAAPASTSRYNPRTGTYSRGAAAWGPYGARGCGEAYNPRTGAYGQTRQGSNVYGSWGSDVQCSAATSGRSTARTTNRATGTTTRATRTSERRRGRHAAAVRGRDLGRRADRQRRRLRRPRRQRLPQRRAAAGRSTTTATGATSTRRRPSPATARTPDRSRRRQRPQHDGTGSAGGVDSSTRDQLNRDSAARRDGQQRSSDYSNYSERRQRPQLELEFELVPLERLPRRRRGTAEGWPPALMRNDL